MITKSNKDIIVERVRGAVAVRRGRAQHLAAPLPVAALLGALPRSHHTPSPTHMLMLLYLIA